MMACFCFVLYILCSSCSSRPNSQPVCVCVLVVWCATSIQPIPEIHPRGLKNGLFVLCCFVVLTRHRHQNTTRSMILVMSSIHLSKTIQWLMEHQSSRHLLLPYRSQCCDQSYTKCVTGRSGLGWRVRNATFPKRHFDGQYRNFMTTSMDIFIGETFSVDPFVRDL